MIKLADIFSYKNGRKKIEFFEMGIYDLLKRLGFRYVKINGKGQYLKEKNGIYELSYFHHLSKSFIKYIEQEFENLEISKEIDLHSFMNEYYKKRPIRNGNYARDYLGEDFQLSAYNRDLILQKIDPKIKFKNDRQEMIEFLEKEKFIETIDSVGNFRKGYPLYYKKQVNNKYLVFNQPYHDSKSKQTIFDFWKIKADSASEFLRKKTRNIVSLKLGFNVLEDIEVYNIENNKNVW
jgi:hypothetical protein